MRHAPWLIPLCALALPLLGALLSTATGCDDTTADTTSGKRVTLKTRLQAETPGAPFTNPLGWTITLRKAAVATGPLYYFDGTPAFTQAPTPRLPGRSRWAALLGPSLAWAHPGHYQRGEARGEQLSPWSADLFAGTTELPEGDGITGFVRSGLFSYATPSAGPATGLLPGGAVALVEGSASRDATTVQFRIAPDLAQLSTRAARGEIEGCVFDEVDLQAGGTVTVTLKPSHWLTLADFKDIAPGTVEAPTVLQPADQPHLAFLSGLAQFTAYQFHYDP